jgi:hypothetical protein
MGRGGILFDEPKEDQVLRSWQERRLDEAEKLMAEDWNRATAAIDLEAIKQTYAERFKNSGYNRFDISRG